MANWLATDQIRQPQPVPNWPLTRWHDAFYLHSGRQSGRHIFAQQLHKWANRRYRWMALHRMWFAEGFHHRGPFCALQSVPRRPIVPHAVEVTMTLAVPPTSMCGFHCRLPSNTKKNRARTTKITKSIRIGASREAHNSLLRNLGRPRLAFFVSKKAAGHAQTYPKMPTMPPGGLLNADYFV